jgi:signal transduction histidine kinase
MTGFFGKISRIGTKATLSALQNRNIIFSNYFATSVIAFCLVLAIVLFLFYQQIILSGCILLTAVASTLPIYFNKIGRYTISRLFLSAETSLACLAISIFSKNAYAEAVDPPNFFDARFLLLSTVIIPITIFRLSERKYFLLGLSFSFLCLSLFDPIHDLLSLGYHDLGQKGGDYYFSANFYALTAYAFLVIGFVFMKSLQEKSESENVRLIQQLTVANTQLVTTNREIELQNNEIQAQSEELTTNQDQLMEALKTIEEQKQQLQGINLGLQSTVIEKNKQLTEANDQLLKYNNELLQFSFTVSHNLRGPIARLLGLSQLLEMEQKNLTPAQFQLVQLIQQSTHEFDGIVKDLSKIIDIRNEIYRIKEKIRFQDEWSVVFNSLQGYLLPGMQVTTQFDAAHIYSIRPIIHSILYNLASNAIKYHSPQRPLNLSIRSSKTDEEVIVEVEDNGLGINLELFGDKLFSLYKRFHTHTEGKGLGLYLVKTQVESVGGRIEVFSELNVGTRFVVHFPLPTEVEGQVVFSSEFGSVFYNARTNAAGIVWHTNVTSAQYRKMFQKCLEMVELYHTPFWISDIRKQGRVDPEDQKWMLTHTFPQAYKFGLRKVALIYLAHEINEDYRSRISATAAQLGVAMEFFTTQVDAEAWILEQSLNLQV